MSPHTYRTDRPRGCLWLFLWPFCRWWTRPQRSRVSWLESRVERLEVRARRLHFAQFNGRQLQEARP